MHKFRGRVLLADEMGLGKTPQALWYMDEAEAFPALVVCPASVKLQWKRETRAFINKRAHVIEGRKVRNLKLLNRAPIVIINYDILRYWQDVLVDIGFASMFVDEGQYLKSRTSQRTRCCKDISRGVKRNGKRKKKNRIRKRIAMTGTPSTKYPADLWPLLNFIRPDLYPSFLKFAFKHCNPKKRYGKWEFKGAKRLKLLRRTLKRELMIRRTKQQVMKDLPKKSRNTIYLSIPRKEYAKAEKDFIGWIKRTHGEKLDSVMRAHRLAQYGYLKRLAAEEKLPSIIEWVHNFLENTNEKLVLFGIHKKIIKVLHEEFKHVSVVVDGSVRGRKRDAAVRQFQNNSKTRIFIGNLQAAGIGLNLTAASTVAFVELGWLPNEIIQAEDRIHRIGQKSQHCSYYYFIAEGTIEERLCKVLLNRQNVIGKTLDDKKRRVKLDILKQIEKTYLRKAA